MGIRERHPPQSKELHTMMPARDAQMKSPERKCYQGYGGILGNFLLFHKTVRLLRPRISFARPEMLHEV